MTLADSDLQTARQWVCSVLSPYREGAPVEAPAEHLWPEIVRLADSWLVGPRLYDRIGEADFIPAEAAGVLAAISEFSALRSGVMRDELVQIVRALNEAGLDPVLFKGAEWLMGHYAPRSFRLIGDLDLWFPTEAERLAALTVFRQLGYTPLTPVEDHDTAHGHHYPPFHRHDAVARVELHYVLLREGLTHLIDLQGVAGRLNQVEVDGLRYFRLAPQDGISIAYLQSGHMASPGFETRKVTLAKWLDFVDRFRDNGVTEVAGPEDLGILEPAGDIDRQLLTALSACFGFPYSGPRDLSYVEGWIKADSFSRSLLSGLLGSLRWKTITSPGAWVRFFKGFRKRVAAARFRSSM